MISAAVVAPDFPAELEVLVDQPRFSFLKRRDDGSVDFVSLFPSPFNYGNVPGTRAPDGDREDVIVLGRGLRAGTQLRARVLGRARFIDAGTVDAKWICGERLGVFERLQIEVFFLLYVQWKRVLNRGRGLPGLTAYQGLELRAPRSQSPRA